MIFSIIMSLTQGFTVDLDKHSILHPPSSSPHHGRRGEASLLVHGRLARP